MKITRPFPVESNLERLRDILMVKEVGEAKVMDVRERGDDLIRASSARGRDLARAETETIASEWGELVHEATERKVETALEGQRVNQSLFCLYI